MGENARFQNGHARVETLAFYNTGVSKRVFGPLSSNGRQRVGALKKRARRKNAFKHNRIQWNRLCVGVRAKNAVACRGLRVGPSKVPPISSRFGSRATQLGMTNQELGTAR